MVHPSKTKSALAGTAATDLFDSDGGILRRGYDVVLQDQHTLAVPLEEALPDLEVA